MSLRPAAPTARGSAIALAFCVAALSVPAAGRAAAPAPLALNSARVSIAGTSNIHPYTASTTTVRLTRLELAAGAAGARLWAVLLAPGGLQAFDIAIPAATLTSPKEGLDKNMHKALKVAEHADITFRLVRLEPRGEAGALRAAGLLRVAGVEREVALDLTTRRTDAALIVNGEVQLLMTDFGIAPPKAMLGMLRTDPKVTVTFEAVLGVELT